MFLVFLHFHIIVFVYARDLVCLRVLSRGSADSRKDSNNESVLFSIGNASNM